MELAPCNLQSVFLTHEEAENFSPPLSARVMELRGFEPARHDLARTTPAIHFNTSNLSKSTGFCKTSVLWWSYGDSNPRGMPSQEQRRRSTSILPIYQRVQGSAKPLYYGGATGIRTREA